MPFYPLSEFRFWLRNDGLEKLGGFIIEGNLRVLKKLFSNMRINCVQFMVSDHPIKKNEFANVDCEPQLKRKLFCDFQFMVVSLLLKYYKA